MARMLAVLDDYQSVAAGFAPWQELADLGIEATFFPEYLGGEDAVVERLRGFEIIVAMRERTPFPRSVLERLPNLRLLVTTGMRNAAIDLAAADDLGVVVSGTAGSAGAAAELSWALLMATVCGIPAQDASLRAGGWQLAPGIELGGRTLGILGLGRIGAAMAGYARAFGMEVLAWSPHMTAERAVEAGVEAVDRQELFDRADIVSVHLRLTDEYRGVVGVDELRRLGLHGYLINTARGPLVDEAALVAALEQGLIAGAGLDVYDREPLPPESALLRAPHTVLTPHIGYVTQEAYRIFYGEAYDDVRAWASGSPIRVLGRGAEG
ncbi:D-2-hydroxyacid dehydrogenase family protein [Paenarthrobacter sp. Z7-10]|uniref:D-2-hydroxyacid dehydrogenase family protein n=1 Tax=Paenarthrobacter sp. Z7-10 TaxID=2787635 RepID=UPI0022A99664|nr:D-2-hydroxyacid dehydrogenase family protein [Paenarthrobacter sp. Z7-10]MCZ2403660.1 D-2-hydroxyacid dehydrogenase family protein [Paenarthrobacter sp. Z7-10]